MDCDADGVAYARSVNAKACAVRVVFEYVRAPFLILVRILVNIGMRADRDVHLPAVAREGYVARPVSAAAQLSSARNIRHDHFRLASGLEVAVAISEAHHCVRIRDIDVLGLRPEWIKGYAEWSVQFSGEDFINVRFARAISRPQHAYSSRVAFGHEDIAVGRSANQSRIIQTRR